MASPDGHVVARIGKPHALRGEVTVQLHTDDPESRLVPGTVFDTRAQPGSGVPRQLTLATTRVHRGIWLLGFEEIPDRTGAESLRGTRLVLAADQPDPSEDDEGWYEEDLVGLTAVDPTGTVVGEVVALELGAAQDRLRLRRPDGGETLVPFVEAIVPEVDPEAGRLVVDAPPGLLDLDAAGE
ncbi:ribosome maturation factor RimM [Janibacter hoylei PVAS-1]|uniref:Ribosome maturation factor RimM n=1 Tax=Janibacter hoylei PVAS-1 TaxID=1210046 RepID=A0A444B0K8_9MICO|nr:ribosome maturation factor RimM [Janibacter hoylei]RWU81883.1 ribosome maturation factor RimM [Janibacter hoylei PVAS-1]